MRPRTVLMTADAVGGVWRYALDLGGALVGRGINVVLIVMGPPPSREDRRDAEATGLVLITRPYRLEWMDDPWKDVERAGQWLLALDRLIQPDVVHLNGYAHAALAWRTPVLVVGHSCVRTWWKAVKHSTAPPDFDRYAGAVRAGLVAAGAVVTPSAAMRAALEREYGVSLDARVIPNGSASVRQVPAVIASKEHFVLAAGRVWDEAKNIQSLCDIAGTLPWPVYVAGETRRPGGAECDVRHARALGRLPAAALAPWYERAAIYALPAKYEPFGLSVLEAAASGCALVLGDIDSLREHWDGAAIFVPPDDPSALREAIGRLIVERSERDRLAAEARGRAAAFTIDRAADAYVELYGRLAS